MELIFIAFLGTLVLMAAELRDFVRRPRTAAASAAASVTAPSGAIGSAASSRSYGDASASSVQEAYDEAA